MGLLDRLEQKALDFVVELAESLTPEQEVEFLDQLIERLSEARETAQEKT